ncbi:MAG: hypothetical protein U0414_23380 [Polyangiaceae bacterium]
MALHHDRLFTLSRLALAALGAAYACACREPARSAPTIGSSGTAVAASAPASSTSAGPPAAANPSAAGDGCDFEHDGKEIADPSAPWNVSAEPLELVDAGQEPRRVLRYAAKRGDERTLQFSIRMRLQMRKNLDSGGWIALPDLSAQPTLRVVSASSTTARVRVTQGPVSAGAPPDPDPAVRFGGKALTAENVADMGEGARKAFAKAGASPFELDVAGDGRFGAGNLMGGEGGPALVAGVAVVPLPADPVGIGARWRVSARVVGAPAATIEATYTYVGEAEGRPVIHASSSARLDESRPHRLVVSDRLHDIQSLAIDEELEMTLDPAFPIGSYERKVSNETVTSECKHGHLEIVGVSSQSEMRLAAK